MKTNQVIFLFIVCLLISSCQTTQAQQFVDLSQYEVTLTSDQAEIVQSGVLSFPATVQLLNQMVNGNMPTGSFIIEYGDDFVFGVPWRDQFALINMTRDGFFARHLGDMFRFSTSSPINAATVVKQLEQAGGKYIQPSQLPGALVSALQGLIQWAAQVSVTIFELPLLVLPAGAFEFDPGCVAGCYDG